MANNPKHKENLVPFPKGVSGNPKGAHKKLPELNILLAEVLGEKKDGVNAARAILIALRAKATKGDIRAAELLLNRAYGMATQKNEVTIKNYDITLDLDA